MKLPTKKKAKGCRRIKNGRSRKTFFGRASKPTKAGKNYRKRKKGWVQRKIEGRTRVWLKSKKKCSPSGGGKKKLEGEIGVP